MRAWECRSGIGTWVSALLVIAAGPTWAVAQADGGPSAAASTPAPSVATDTFLVAVPNRDTATIQREIGATVQRRMSAEATLQRLAESRSGTQLKVDDMKRRIAAIGDRVNAAKKEKRDADRARLEVERKAAEREKALLERRVALQQAEMDAKKKETEAAELQRKGLELEVQLALKRADQSRPAHGTVQRASYEQVLIDLERQVLQSQRAALAKAAEATAGEKSVVERRLQILDAQRNLMAGK